MNYNSISLVGRLADNVEYTPAKEGLASKAKGRLAVNRPPGTGGTSKVDYIPIVAWGTLADNLAQWTSKGKELAIGGRLQINDVPPRTEGDSWRSFTEVLVMHVSFGHDSEQEKTQKAIKGAAEVVKQQTTAILDSKVLEAVKQNPSLQLEIEKALGTVKMGSSPKAILKEDSDNNPFSF